MSAMVFVFVPTVVFLVIVAPLWLILHYWSKKKESEGLSSQDQIIVEEIGQNVETLCARIETLETILDEQHEGWRNRD